MEFPHTQSHSGCLSRVGSPPRQNPLPDSVILRSWVKNKLDTVPSTYKKYDEGMQAIKNQIQQDFFPEHHSYVMQAFYQEFYAAIGVVSGETGEGIWARWRANHRVGVQNRRISSLYSTADIEDGIDPPSAFQNRRATSGILAGISQGMDAARERQIRNSVLISEAEAKLLQNRNSNYWGDLAIPVLPQTAGKAKIVYIPPKSARNTVNIENQQLSIDPTILARSLSLRRNSLPAPTSLIGGPNARAIAKKILIHSDDLLSVADLSGSASLYAAAEDANITLQKSVVPLGTYDGNFLLHSSGSAPIALTSAATSESPCSRSESSSREGVTYTSATGTFGRSTKIRPDFSPHGTPEDFHSPPHTPPTRGTPGSITKRRGVAGLKLLDALYPGDVRVSPGEEIGHAVRSDGDVLEIHLEGVPLHEVHQGHGALGTRSPVVSMMASPTSLSFVIGEGDILYQAKIPRPIKKPVESLGSTPPSSQDSPFHFYELPESAYSGSSGGSNNGLGARSTREHYGLSLGNRDLDFQNEIICERAESSYTPKTLENSYTQEPLWHEKNSTYLNQYQPTPCDQSPRNSTPVTRTETSHIEGELDTTNSHLGVTPKLRSRFSFVLPNIHLGSRTAAHNTRRRSSLQSSGLKVTREVLREEEEDISGNPNEPSFTTHVPRFGKDPMKEIHKAHTRSETKKSAFLKVIQDVVHDRIDFSRKTSTRTDTPDVNSLRTSLKQHGKVNKLTISEPMHDGNPLKMSNSSSTPNVLKNATPIHGLTHSDSIPSQNLAKPSIVLQKLPPHVVSKPRTVLTPWELDNTPMAADEFLSSGDEHENAPSIYQERKPHSKSEGQPTITIDPFSQGALYSWIECSVVQACSDFLKQQQKQLDLNILKKEVKRWKNSQVKLSTGEAKPRDSPIEFMFGMEVQCKLLERNYKSEFLPNNHLILTKTLLRRMLHFSGPSAMNPVTVINAWRNIIPSFSPRTFCLPDYLILEHLRVTEKVLRLFGPAYWDSTIFEMKRAQIVKRIMEAGQLRKEWSRSEKMARLKRDRERAEASLLQAVGIWSTEDTPVDVTPGVIGNGEGRCQ